MILESPVRPVTEEGSVTLRCKTREFIPEVICHFYRDGFMVGNSSSGNLTITSISVSDAGLYTCQCGGDFSEVGRPPQRSEPHISVVCIALPVIAACVLTVCMILFCLRRKRKEREKRDLPYTDVTIIQTPQPRRFKDLKNEDDTSTFYSTLSLNNIT